MSDYQWNKINMYVGILFFLGNSAAITGTIEAFAELITNLTSAVNAIKLKIHEQIAPSDETVESKNNSRDMLEDYLHSFCRGCFLAAKKLANTELMGIFNIKAGKIQKLKDQELIEFTDLVLKKAEPIKAEALKFCITQTKIDKLGTLHIGFSSGKSAVVDTGDTKTLATRSLADLFKYTDKILDDIDDIVDVMKEDNPDFAVMYSLKREIKKLGVRHVVEPAEEPVAPPVG